MRKLSPDRLVRIVALAVLAYEWFHAGYGKVADSEFIARMPGTLQHFATDNPYGWYVSFLRSTAMPNASLFGHLVSWGQVAIGVALVVAVLVMLFPQKPSINTAVSMLAGVALFGGIIMSFNFYYAAGWSSPSTAGLNVVMFWLQVALLAAIKMEYWEARLRRVPRP